MKTYRKMILFALVLLLSGLGGQVALAEEAGPRMIQLKVEYGMKSVTARQFDILARHSTKVREGEKAEIEKKGLEDDRGFRMEITTTIGSENPELMILQIKAWELRIVTEDGQSVQKFVPVLDQTSRVARGATLVVSERAGIDRDIVFNITPYYSLASVDKSGDVEIID